MTIALTFFHMEVPPEAHYRRSHLDDVFPAHRRPRPLPPPHRELLYPVPALLRPHQHLGIPEPVVSGDRREEGKEAVTPKPLKPALVVVERTPKNRPDK